VIRAARLLFTALLLAGYAPAYYHFTHFSSRQAPFRPIPEKFDINALPNQTLTYFIDDASGLQLADGDSYPSLVSEIRAASGVWNDVASSSLRLTFGGFSSPGASQSAPSVDILFEEVPPGLIAMGGPTVRAAANSEFVPIVKSVVIIQPDLRNRPSYSEELFSTLVHEMGHALGLQHTLTSSVMSTSTTRSTSKARPLSTDDVAALSILYPRSGFAQSTGVIAGRVSMNGQGVNLASVVAVAPNGAAVSALTNPDGTYRIEGLPPRNYFVYVHPLPPPREGQASPADITLPQDADGNTFGVGAPFETVFYTSGGGVKEPQRATVVPAVAGVPTEDINFSVRRRTGYAIHSVETYAFPGSTAVKPPYLSPGMTNPFVVAAGNGLLSASGLVQGLKATVLGGADLSIRPYPSAPDSYIELDFDQRTLAVPSNSPRHVVFSTSSDIYVLPSAFFHVDRQPPKITGITSVNDGDGRSAIVLGNNFSSATRVLFDGVEAQIRNSEDLGGNSMRLTVTPPPAAPGQRAVIAALNSDGQSSLFVQGTEAPAYVYPGDAAAQTASVTVASPAALSPGMEALLQIDGLNTQFAEGQTAVGFGSSDIVVRRVWVVNSGRALVNVQVAPTAQAGSLNLTLVSGLQIVRQSSAFAIQAPPPRPFWLSSDVTSAGNRSISPGRIVTVRVGATPASLSVGNVSAVLNEVSVPVLSVDQNSVTFRIPESFPPGVATLRLETGTERSLPTGITVEPAPPRILSTSLVNGDARTPRVGDTLLMTVSNLNSTISQVSVRVGTKDGKVLQVFGDADKSTVVFQLPDDVVAGEDVQVTVSDGKRTSDPIGITITK
jgi:hypothetical protein